MTEEPSAIAQLFAEALSSAPPKPNRGRRRIAPKDSVDVQRAEWVERLMGDRPDLFKTRIQTIEQLKTAYYDRDWIERTRHEHTKLGTYDEGKFDEKISLMKALFGPALTTIEQSVSRGFRKLRDLREQS
ncbi:hypothetical protein O2N63_09015 [Aliiroseovarius sp. KMU-50]|uniref:Uncharacterized protein n=1 Tax=Aliiroseovarius salicola TaxID=3009082 RepID=A0ABT4W147_9RHOB|nr:hypothetical protein [Aliiroseovarius sp. KMU-50]MDA5094228.1 hypothetical protein [Aliiroseovarius sp. KMU-50]